jgi:hypothetical protein
MEGPHPFGEPRPPAQDRPTDGAKLLVAVAKTGASAMLLPPGSVEQAAEREFKFPMHVDGQVRSLFFHIVPHDRPRSFGQIFRGTPLQRNIKKVSRYERAADAPNATSFFMGTRTAASGLRRPPNITFLRVFTVPTLHHIDKWISPRNIVIAVCSPDPLEITGVQPGRFRPVSFYFFNVYSGPKRCGSILIEVSRFSGECLTIFVELDQKVTISLPMYLLSVLFNDFIPL